MRSHIRYDISYLFFYMEQLLTVFYLGDVCGYQRRRSLGSDETRKPVLGPWTSATAAMKLTSAITLGPWTLAQSTSTGLRLAPDALPIWAKEPRSDVAFHNAQISTVHGVILYPILNGVARCGCLGPRAEQN